MSSCLSSSIRRASGKISLEEIVGWSVGGGEEEEEGGDTTVLILVSGIVVTGSAAVAAAFDDDADDEDILSTYLARIPVLTLNLFSNYKIVFPLGVFRLLTCCITLYFFYS